jgi:hypothetical protein
MITKEKYLQAVFKQTKQQQQQQQQQQQGNARFTNLCIL